MRLSSGFVFTSLAALSWAVSILEGLKYATASYVTMIFSLTPIFVSLMAIPLLKESLAPIQIVGGILIILAGVSVEKLKI